MGGFNFSYIYFRNYTTKSMLEFISFYSIGKLMSTSWLCHLARDQSLTFMANSCIHFFIESKHRSFAFFSHRTINHFCKLQMKVCEAPLSEQSPDRTHEPFSSFHFISAWNFSCLGVRAI